MEAEMRKEERNKDNHSTYLLARYSGHWRKPIHKTIKDLKKKRGLGWLRPRMIHKCHQNLKEMLLADINSKCRRGVEEVGYVKKTKKKNAPAASK